MVIILVIALALFGVFSMVSSYKTVANGGLVNYDYDTLQEYADEQYAKEFGSSSAYEDNILIVLVTAENNKDFDWMCWVGDHVKTNITNMFGAQGTTFGNAILSSVNEYSYQYSLTSNLSSVIDTMESEIKRVAPDSSFSDICTDTQHSNIAHVTNKTELSINAQTLNATLQSFTDETGIPIVIVVDTAENVFGKYVPFGDIMMIVLSLVILGVAIFFIVRTVKKNKNGQNGNNSNYNNNGYNNGYDQNYNGNNYNGNY